MIRREATLRGPAVTAATAAGFAVAAFSLTMALASQASAHASLISSTPDDGATITQAPTQLELTFDENIRQPSTIIVIAPDRKHVENGPTQILNATVTQPLDEITTAGRYTMAYRVISADGHPVSGQLTFTYAPPGTTATAAASAAPGQSSSGQGALSGHGAHLVGLGILVAAALIASFMALKKDREYDRTPAKHRKAAVGSQGARSGVQRGRRN